jgi:hypothetical protein
MPPPSDYLQNFDLQGCKHFLAAMRNSKLVMHVHPLETQETKREVHEFIRPYVEGFYGRNDFDLSMLLGGMADPYFAVTLVEEPRTWLLARFSDQHRRDSLRGHALGGRQLPAAARHEVGGVLLGQERPVCQGQSGGQAGGDGQGVLEHRRQLRCLDQGHALRRVF